MIPVPHPIPEPEWFDMNCRRNGLAWLEQHPDCERPKDFWSPFRLALAKGFSDRCGYGAMWISSGTVDHFVSVNTNKALAYEWSNYRYVEGWINSCKSKRNEAEIIDPFMVESGWFEILLPSLQLVISDTIPAEFKQRAENTLNWLHLMSDERILKQRRAWYQEDGLSLEGLRKKAPLIAAAAEKQSVDIA